MPATRKPLRVTVTHRAAVCALVLAGLPFTDSCEIAGVPFRRLQEVLGADWWTRRPHRRPTRWTGAALASLRAGWDDLTKPLPALAAAHGIKVKHLRRIAVRLGWPSRPRVSKPILPVPYAALTAKQRWQYDKIRKILGRAAAVQAVFGAASARAS